MKKYVISAVIFIISIISANAQEIGLHTGVTIGKTVNPIVGFSYGDQIGHSERFSFELAASAMLKEYESDATSAGKTYFSMRTMAMGKVAVLKKDKHCFNLIAGFGYEFKRHDDELVAGFEDGEITYNVSYRGNAFVGAAGIEYRFSLTPRNTIAIKAMVTNESELHYDRTIGAWGGTVAFCYSFAL